jgi:hypothetical protein
MEIGRKSFPLNGNDYEIVVEVNGDLATGDFVATPYLAGKVVGDPVRKNVMQSLVDTMDNNCKSPLADIITAVENNIMQNQSMKR